MKKNSLFLLMLCMLSISVFAQKMPLKDNQYRGHIIKSDGALEEGIIQLKGGDTSPWLNQGELKFLPLAKYEGGEVKRKDWEEYSPKQISGYKIGEKTYVSQKYANLSAVGPDMLSRPYFLEKVVEGKLTLYYFYETPPTVYSGGDIAQLAEEAKTKCRIPQVLIQKDGDKLKNLRAIDFRDYIGDNVEVLGKYNAGDYGFVPRAQEKKGLANLTARAEDGEILENYIVPIATDYNNTSK